MDEEEVVYLKVFDKEKGDVVFEGKVSTDVEPDELVRIGCFWDRGLSGVSDKATGENLKSFKGLQNNVELVAADAGLFKDFFGVLYGAEDKVLRKSKNVPSCECVMMSVCTLSHDECEKAFKCETLEELETFWCKLRQISKEIGGMKKLKRLRLVGLDDLESIPEEIGDLSNLEDLWIWACGVESLPKRLKELKMLRTISLLGLYDLHLNAEHLVVFSKLRHLAIRGCHKLFNSSFARAFWEMIKSTTDIRVLELNWNDHNRELVVSALKENGSIVDGGLFSEYYAQYFKRNNENYERARECVVQLLAIRRCRNALNGVPKEMARMLGMMIWMTRCDVEAWRISDKQTRKKARIDE